MNPERRIFYGLLDTPAQIDQRAIGFKPNVESLNLELCHALLNSVIGVFYTEATGFPKGLAALDNCAENVRKIKMLDPRRLTTDEAQRIQCSFRPLLSRKIKTTEEEYSQDDRLAFERTVADVYGYSAAFDKVLGCILEMQRVRLSVRA
ncbi:hypothetical protein SDC9_174741 [bioreactor metagenome]|uniref:Uncharacterized protein n=1 Tax=bioreactor metagenome TaxID=1076179 RepID=A0A645GMB6_9ZZZZ